MTDEGSNSNSVTDFITDSGYTHCSCKGWSTCPPLSSKLVALDILYVAYSDYCKPLNQIPVSLDDFFLDFQNAGFSVSGHGNVKIGIRWFVHIGKPETTAIPSDGFAARFMKSLGFTPCNCTKEAICDSEAKETKYIPLEVLYKEYAVHCKHHEIPACTQNDFFIDVQHAGFTVSGYGNELYGFSWTVHANWTQV